MFAICANYKKSGLMSTIWLLVTGFWKLVSGHELLVSLDARCWMLDIR
jgi:hypothetical protein